jgi:hypothetical protein
LTHEQLLVKFREYRARLDEAYDRVEAHMEAERWDAAWTTLAYITQLHARNAVGLRNVLVRMGLMRGDDA